MKKLMLVCFCAVAFAIGCSKHSRPDAAVLQGTWTGTEAKNPGADSMTLDGSNLEFHGANPQEWYKGTYTLREDVTPKQMIIQITDCPFPQAVGKTANAIFKIEDGTLTLCGNAPGNPNMPRGFGAPGTRTIVFKVK